MIAPSGSTTTVMPWLLLRVMYSARASAAPLPAAALALPLASALALASRPTQGCGIGKEALVASGGLLLLPPAPEVLVSSAGWVLMSAAGVAAAPAPFDAAGNVSLPAVSGGGS